MRLQATLPFRLSVAFAAVLAIGGCDFEASAANVSESFQQTVALAPGGSFELSNVNGSIDVIPWDRDEVEIRAVKRAGSQARLDAIEINVREEPGRVTVKTELPRTGNGVVDYDIRTPAAASVTLRNVNGRVTIDGLDGPVDIRSVNGAIEADGLSQSTAIETVNGAITATYAAAPTAGRHRFEAVNGAIRLYLPAGAGGRFEAKTVNGSIKNDMGLEVKKARFGPMSSLEGTIGPGEAEIELETVNGSIRILNEARSSETR